MKTPHKGDRLRDQYQEPMFSLDNAKINFPYKLLDWLQLWKGRTMSYDSRKLTKGTYAALHQTTQGLIECTRYCFEELKLSYILAGKIQLNALENRFGKYKHLADAQYRMLMRPVHECENKLAAAEHATNGRHSR